MFALKSHLFLILNTLSFALALPVAIKLVDVKRIDSDTVTLTLEAKLLNSSTGVKDKLRQDGDGEGGGEEISEIEMVGTQVGQIISGVLSGNIQNIFGGASGFIGEEDTKNGVGTILQSIGKPFNQLLITSVQTGQKYFGITDPPAILLAPTSPTTKNPALVGINGQLIVTPIPQIQPLPPIQSVQPVQYLPANKQQSTNNYVTKTPAPLYKPPVQTGDNDDDEIDTDDSRRKL